MSSVFLNVGQCGVQLGQAFWTLVQERVNGDGEHHPFVTLDRCQRRVLVDTEPKVLANVRKLEQQRGGRKSATAGKNHWTIRDENVLVSRRGRGANWAMGYNKAVEVSGKAHGPALLDQVLDSVRREVERCDAFSGFFLTHSMSGGTGSGMGSRLVESLRDEYPFAMQLSACVAPSVRGENPMQSYNCLLCLQHLYTHCDAVLLMENDLLVKCCQEERSSAQHRPPTSSARSFSAVTVDDLNRYSAEALAGLLLPTDSADPRKDRWCLGLEPWELVRSVCPMPSLKLFTVDHTRQTHARSWSAMAEQLSRQHRLYRYGHQMVVTDDSIAGLLERTGGGHGQCVSMVAVARGVRRASFAAEIASVEKSLVRGYKCVPWNPSAVDLWTSKMAGGSRASTTLTVASNGAASSAPVADMLDRAERMFESGAFLHWYERYGCGREQFGEAFESAHVILDDYAQAVN